MTTRRHLPTPAVELPLAGLLTEPDPGAAERMAAHDALSLGLRRELEECPFDFNAPKALAAVRERGGLDTLRLIRTSVVRERQRWVRDRDAALAWAREAFRNDHVRSTSRRPRGDRSTTLLRAKENTMSWQVTATIFGNSPVDELTALRPEATMQNPECGDQFEAARDAAYAVLASGAVGGPGKKFVVAMSGHANPKHEPRPGWATDTITVVVTQAMF